MNKEQAEGKYEQIKGKLKETWGRLTDDDIALYQGRRDQFLGKVEEKYGLVKEEAESRLKEMERKWDRMGDAA
jgi:uncharacterized protein YjbJ (UPF0337 family)